MKLSFSTLGCPEWSFSDIYSTAADFGYGGIEVRGIEDELYAPKIPAFDSKNIDELKSKLEKRNLQIPMLTSGAYLCGCSDIFAQEFEVKDYILLAQKLGVPYVRVLAEQTPQPCMKIDLDKTVGAYAELCRFAALHGVCLLIETNGNLADSAMMRRFMEEARALLPDDTSSGVIWDIHHTWRYFGEEPGKTVENIGGYIRHVHVKDSVLGSNGIVTYMLTGYGDVPVSGAVSALRGIGYDGFLSYEWVKRWAPDLAEPGVALYQYVDYMKKLLK